MLDSYVSKGLVKAIERVRKDSQKMEDDEYAAIYPWPELNTSSKTRLAYPQDGEGMYPRDEMGTRRRISTNACDLTRTFYGIAQL